MAHWSQSHFLQSLGWATLNSFWQMALLWCLFLLASQLLKLSSQQRYKAAVASMLTGFFFFLFSFFTFYQNPGMATLGLFDLSFTDSGNFFQVCLISASTAYLLLLIFPSYRLFRNWQFVKKIKSQGLHKADVHYRIFVQKIASRLGITKKVYVYVSDIIRSPLTVGYLKPVILLPVAALNHLSIQQVEAVLLHELSHIRRFDYLVNFVISIIHTILYFNPFVKGFIRTIEKERENCCDELVLQFGYDKVGYATALLTLEKISAQHGALALAATGKNYLLSRIEKIVGLEKKKGLGVKQLVSIVAALFLIAAFNSILIIKEKKRSEIAFDHSVMGNPFQLFQDGGSPEASTSKRSGLPAVVHEGKAKQKTDLPVPIQEMSDVAMEETPVFLEESGALPGLMAVAHDEVQASLDAEQTKQVAATVEATRKIVNSLQWQQIEAQIGDALSSREKAEAEREYRKEIEKINWVNVENNLKAQYKEVDWNRINNSLSQAMNEIQLDSIQTSYQMILTELAKAETALSKQATASNTPIPDGSVEEISKAKEEMKARIKEVKALKNKAKAIKL